MKHKTVYEAFGISKRRADEIFDTIINLYSKGGTYTGLLNNSLAISTNEKEHIYIAFRVGQICGMGSSIEATGLTGL